MDAISRVLICEKCGEHARIVFSDGTQGTEFWTRHMGFESIIAYDNAGHFKKGEASELGRQVSASGLPRDRSEMTHSDRMCPEFQKLLAQLSQIQEAPNIAN